jgi:hypothetical protein
MEWTRWRSTRGFCKDSETHTHMRFYAASVIRWGNELRDNCSFIVVGMLNFGITTSNPVHDFHLRTVYAIRAFVEAR